MLKKSSRQKYLVISHNSSPYVFDCFCTSGWNIFCQFWEGYPISPRLQHHFGSISGWGVKTSSDHCNKSLWFTQSGCNTGFRRMLRLLRKKWDQNKVNIAKPKKTPTISYNCCWVLPQNQQFMKTSIWKPSGSNLSLHLLTCHSSLTTEGVLTNLQLRYIQKTSPKRCHRQSIWIS